MTPSTPGAAATDDVSGSRVQPPFTKENHEQHAVDNRHGPLPRGRRPPDGPPAPDELDARTFRSTRRRPSPGRRLSLWDASAGAGLAALLARGLGLRPLLRLRLGPPGGCRSGAQAPSPPGRRPRRRPGVRYRACASACAAFRAVFRMSRVMKRAMPANRAPVVPMMSQNAVPPRPSSLVCRACGAAARAPPAWVAAPTGAAGG